MFSTPSFWQTRNLLAIILLPLAFVYMALSWLSRKLTYSYESKLPVVCVGNVTAGGAGKTPVCIELIKILKNLGYNPAVISRGYGGNIKGAILVDPKSHNYLEVGDEPMLLSQYAPVFVSKDKIAAVKLAEKSGADILLMDDGLQSNKIKKDKSILVIDGMTGIGNGYMIPAGPLRQSLKSAIKEVCCVIIIGDDKTNIASSINRDILLSGKIKTILPKEIEGKNVIAFAGIAYPEKFFDSLKKTNCNIVSKHSFADHYSYTDSDINKLVKKAKDNSAVLITTEKDFVRIPLQYKLLVQILPMSIEFATKDIKKLQLLLGINA